MSAVTNNEGGAGVKLNMDEEVFVYPTSYSQQGIWFINQMDPDSSAYCIPFGFQIRGALDLNALKKAVNEIVRRHEAFRTTFSFIGEAPVQVVAQKLHLDVPLIDLSQFVGEEKDKELSRLLDEESNYVFDLANGPLIRTSVIRLANDDHIFRLNIHHIILDHLSVGQFASELTTLYAAYSENKTSSLVEPALHYGDYAVWQQEWQSPKELESKLAFWQEQKDKLDNVLRLPTDGSRPATQTFGGVEKHFSFPLSLVDALRELSRGEAVSMFITMLAAYKVLLHRYTGQPIISVGCPYANRGQQIELEQVMGCFINTLPLATKFEDGLTFKELLKLVRKSVFSVNANQEVPFELIVEELHPTRDMSYNPMFQVGFMLQDSPMVLELKGLDVTSLRLHNNSSKFDMMIWLWDSEDGALDGILEYNTDLWGQQTIDLFVGHYQALLESIALNPDVPIEKLPIMRDEEQRRLLCEWNATTVAYPSETGFHKLIEAQSVSTPDAVAVQCGVESLTYDELNRRSNKLAHYLVKQGVKVETLVGICMNRSIDMMVSLLGVLKAGGAYLPLDPAFPEERLAFMLEDAKAPLLLIESSLRSELPETQAQIVCVNELGSLLDDEGDEAPLVEVAAENLAYVIYTSGSTGKPKGVQVPHGGVVNFLSSMARQPGLTADDVLVAVTTLSFDIAVLELYLPLIVGGKCVIATRDVASDGQMLLALLESSDATVMQATPATWRLLIAAGWKGSERFKVLCGGEAMPHDLIGELISRAGSVWNMYGPTETTVWSTCYQLTDADAPALIGKPIDNTQIYILDERMNPVPAGVYGEIYIGGSGVTRGYLDRPELTAERFIDDPFSEKAGAKLYLTGDLGRYLADGNIEYQSRNDGQIKLRGFRIELGEIESNLLKYEVVDQCVVTVREDRPGDQRLVAYVVFKQGQSATVTEIRTHLRSMLPEYMVPQHLVELDVLPITPNGKIDRNHLPAVDSDEVGTDEGYVEARTELEKKLVVIWEEVLGIERLSIYSNFFDMGGHSLLLARAISKMRDELGIKIPFRMIFESPAVASIAEYEEARLSIDSNLVRASSAEKIDDDREEMEF